MTHPQSMFQPLRSLPSLKWPYVPEESPYPDPLERDNLKPLQLRHYKAIGEFIYLLSRFAPW